MSDLSRIDHLVLAGPDLEALGEWWAGVAGQPATPGGSHTGVGTRNELIGIDGTTYIELIGPDLEQPKPADPRPFEIDRRSAHAFARFALAVDDVDAVAATLGEHGFETGPVIAMERTRPDGVRLAWKLCVPPTEELAMVMPFFIQWDDAAHPAADLNPECSLESLSISHPNGAAISAAVEAATGSKLDISDGAASLEAVLRFANSGDELTIRSTAG